MASNRLTALVLVGCSSVLVGLSGALAYGEIAPYLLGGLSHEKRFVTIAAGDYSPGGSLWSKNLYFNDCLDVSASMFARAQPTARRDTFLNHCLDSAAAVTADMPTYSLAWLVMASAAAELGRFDTFHRGLAQSFATAPHVHWLADRRATLAFEFSDDLNDADQAVFDADLASLLQGYNGRTALAERYVRRPVLRDRITAIVEAGTPEQQAEFLGEVRRLTLGAPN